MLNAMLLFIIIILGHIAVHSIGCGLLLQLQHALSVRLSIGHDHEPYKNGWTDQGAIYDGHSGGQGTMY